MRRIGRIIIGLFALIGLIVVLLVAGAGTLAWKFAKREPSLPDTIVISADLTGGLTDGPGDDEFSRLAFGGKKTLRDVIDALDRAGTDSRVKGLYLRLGDDSLGLGKVQELRDAIAAFRAKGKFAIAFAETYGELGPGTRPYYLATACDQLWLQPLGAVGLTGLYTEVPFIRGTLDKLGITADFEHRSEFKSATNSLTDTTMTAPQREETEALLTATSAQIASGIATTRKLSPAAVEGLIDRGPYFADEARQAGLIDRVGYRDEADAAARQRAGPGAELVTLAHYLETAGRPHRSGPTIALIYATGLITRGTGEASPLTGNQEASARRIGRALRAAARDDKVHAILLRIDSPGGSAIASETIWREVERARLRGKPVIVSMGDVAASGGYYIAAPADKIVAEPATLTGSIGVLAGKVVIGGLLQKLGVTIDTAQRGANAGMFSALNDFSPEGKRRLGDFLDLTYAGFKDHVAAGRHMSADAVEAVAKGRVWSGEEAKAKGLVDALGGYATAIRLAQEAAKLAPDAPFKLTVFSGEKSAVQLLYDRLTGSDEDEGGSSATLERSFIALRTALGQVDAAVGDRGVLRMPAIGEIR